MFLPHHCFLHPFAHYNWFSLPSTNFMQTLLTCCCCCCSCWLTHWIIPRKDFEFTAHNSTYKSSHWSAYAGKRESLYRFFLNFHLHTSCKLYSYAAAAAADWPTEPLLLKPLSSPPTIRPTNPPTDQPTPVRERVCTVFFHFWTFYFHLPCFGSVLPFSIHPLIQY